MVTVCASPSECITTILLFVSNLLGMWWKLIWPMRHVCFLAIVNWDLNLSHWEWGSSPCQRGEWLQREPNKSRALGAGRWDSTCQINLRSNGDAWSSKTFTLYNYMTVNCSCAVYVTDTHRSTDSTDILSQNVYSLVFMQPENVFSFTCMCGFVRFSMTVQVWPVIFLP